MPQDRRHHKVRRNGGGGDVFIPVIIILLVITILSLIIAFAWQKWQDIYDPDYLYPGDRSSSSSQSESSSSEASSSSEESSSEPESSAVAFGQPVPESERVTSAYFDDAVFIGDSLTTGIQLYNILPDTTVLASVGININNIFTNEVINDGNGGQQTILDAAKGIQPAKIYTMLGTNGLKGLGPQETVRYYRQLVQQLKADHPDSIIYVQSLMPINEEIFAANYGYELTNAEIDECNELLMQMAGEEEVYFVNCAEAIKDENGELPAEFTTDGLHFRGEYYNKWIDYLKEHTVPEA